MDGLYDWNNYRNYEVQVWTLQDNYITTLKSADPLVIQQSSGAPAMAWPQTRQRGQIQNGQMTINIDGTQTFSFDIPMYIYTMEGQKIENPSWYNTIDKNVLISMRKIKVIFDKSNPDITDKTKSTFEFIILKVQETHEQDDLMCHVECEGLAFHELGKIGYKRSLSIEEFQNEYYEWTKSKVGVGEKYATEQERLAAKPLNNLQYWMSKAKIDPKPINADEINPTKWYYEIRMVHSSMVHENTVYYDKIYEEGVPTDWNEDGQPTKYMEMREMARSMDVNESNLYNITQDLAEKFTVFCRYEYTYDDNYNIIGRTIVFYNNFLQEGEDVTTLMYPNSASRVQREMDSTDVSTKMFVRSVDSDELYNGVVTIMDCDANKTHEDYLMNFDYLHEIGTISDEQYAAIDVFEGKVRKMNDKLVPLQDAYNDLSDLKVDIEAQVKVLAESIEQDAERITEQEDKINMIDASDGTVDGYISLDWRNPDQMALMKDSSDPRYDSYYVQFNQNDKAGVDLESVKLYQNYSLSSIKSTQYAIGYYSFDKQTLKNKLETSKWTNSKIPEIKIPGSTKVPNDEYYYKWKDYQIVVKGTIGPIYTTSSLPVANKDTLGWYYQVKSLDGLSSYAKLKVNNYLFCKKLQKTDDNGNVLYKWEVRTREPHPEKDKQTSESNTTVAPSDKGELGKSADLTKNDMPDEPEDGWVYKVIYTNESTIFGVSGIRKGTLLMYENGSWHKLNPPEPAQGSKPTQETIINNGFFVYKRERLKQINGPVTERVTSQRYGATTTTDYINDVQFIYYTQGHTTDAGKYPKFPVIASAKTKATEIIGYDEVEKWSTYLSAPTDNDLSNFANEYDVFCVLRTKNSAGSTEFFGKQNNKRCTGDMKIVKDADGKVIANQMANAKNEFLSGPIEGTFQLDEYGNLDKITGLYKRLKNGSYYTYGLHEKKVLLSDRNITMKAVDSIVSNLKKHSTRSTMPTNYKDKYVIINEAYYHTNGNVTNSYTLKYYNANGVEDTPTIVNDKHPVYKITPIFFLKDTRTITANGDKHDAILYGQYVQVSNNTHTLSNGLYKSKATLSKDAQITSSNMEAVSSGTAASQKIPKPTNNNVKSDKVLNSWTTKLPDKTHNSQQYYRGWKIERYNSNEENGKTTYVGVTKDTKLKKRPNVAATSEQDGEIPNIIYATYRYKPSLYYEQIKDSWMRKLKIDQTQHLFKSARLAAIKKALETTKTQVDTAVEEKHVLVDKFERMMGAALRESYWQPEDEYQDYGSNYDETLNLHWYHAAADHNAKMYTNLTEDHFAGIGWDPFVRDEEQKLYYEEGVNREKVYYPCINLSQLCVNESLRKNNNIPQNLNTLVTFLTCYRDWALKKQENENNDPTEADVADPTAIPDTDDEHYETSYIDNTGGSGAPAETDEYYAVDSEHDAKIEQDSTDGSGNDVNQIFDDPDKIDTSAQFLFFYNPNTETIPEGENPNDLRYCKYYSIGSTAKLAFVRKNSNNDETVLPVLLLTGAEALSETALTNLRESGCLGLVSSNLINTESDPERNIPASSSAILAYEDNQTFGVKYNGAWLDTSNDAYEIVYPRIAIPSLKLKTGDKHLTISHKNDNEEESVFERYEDYYTFVESYYLTSIADKTINNVKWRVEQLQDLAYTTEDDLGKLEYEIKKNDKVVKVVPTYRTYYTITIKPETLYRDIDFSDIYEISKISGSNKLKVKIKATRETSPIHIYYSLSNADLDIYLDAKKVLKENAYPKVSYDITVSLWSASLLEHLYTRLAQLVMINDFELKFENTFGYISQLTLDLDHQEKDSIEVKNYKTKFEDLFSKIVAETEEMHKNSHNIGLAGAMASGQGVDITLTPETIENAINDPTIQDILENFLHDYFDGPNIVQQQLSEMWDEAGSIFGAAAQSLTAVMGLTTENASILAGFKENVAAALTPRIFTGDVQPESFKPGDIWINNDGSRSVATGYSATGGGFTQTYNGKLSEISGANVTWNADTGIVDITGEHKINLMSGQNIDIMAGDTVNIVGNKEINIGGTTINMASSNIIGKGFDGIVGGGGIHLVASEYNYDYVEPDNDDEIGTYGTMIESGISRVDIHGTGIQLQSKYGIVIKSGAGIDIKSADDENVSAIQIDKDKGIFVGSNQQIRLYSGVAANYFVGPYHGAKFMAGDYWIRLSKKYQNSQEISNLDGNTGKQLSQSKNYYYLNLHNNTLFPVGEITYYRAVADWSEYYDENTVMNGVESIDGWDELEGAPNINIYGASVELSPEHLLLGMANTSNMSATAIEMTEKQIVIAAGSDIDQLKVENDKLTDMGGAQLSGIQIQKNYIGMATGSGNSRSLLSLKPKKVLIGTVSRNSQYQFDESSDDKSGWQTTAIYLVPEPADDDTKDDKDFYNKYEYKNNAWTKTATHIGPEAYTGSYLWLAENEVYIGSLGHFTLNTNNVKIQTKLLNEARMDANTFGFCLGYNLQGLDKDTNGNTIAPEPLFNFWTDKDNLGKVSAHLNIKVSQLQILNGETYQDLSNYMNSSVRYSMRVYYAHTSNSTEPADSVTWTTFIPQTTKDNPYIWSALKKQTWSQQNANPNDFIYTDKKFESDLTVSGKTTYHEYTRTAKNASPNSNNTWTRTLPSSTISPDSTALGNADSTTHNGTYNNNVDSLPWVWQRMVTEYTNGTKTYGTAARYALAERLSEAAIQALNIASGQIAVPHVLSTGVCIDGNNLSLTAQGTLSVCANASVQIMSDSSNSAVILDHNGIQIASGSDIAVVAGGSLFLGTTRTNRNYPNSDDTVIGNCIIMDSAMIDNVPVARMHIETDKLRIKTGNFRLSEGGKVRITVSATKNIDDGNTGDDNSPESVDFYSNTKRLAKILYRGAANDEEFFRVAAPRSRAYIEFGANGGAMNIFSRNSISLTGTLTVNSAATFSDTTTFNSTVNFEQTGGVPVFKSGGTSDGTSAPYGHFKLFMHIETEKEGSTNKVYGQLYCKMKYDDDPSDNPWCTGIKLGNRQLLYTYTS